MRVGLIGFGAAASALARGFNEQGSPVLVYCSGPNNRPPYSEAFRRKVGEAGASLAESPAELAAQADFIFFAAPYTSSVETARLIAPALRDGTVYADLSNAPPQVKVEACRIVSGTPVSYVDVGVLGEIARQGPKTFVVASGPGARMFCERMAPFGMRADYVGAEPGKAATLKMLANVFTKGVAALAFEVMLPAERLGITDEVYRYAMQALDDMPLSEFTVTRMGGAGVHAPRRSEEMAAIVEDLEAMGFDPIVTRATRDMHRRLAQWGTREALDGKVPADWRHALRTVAALDVPKQEQRA